MHTTVSIVIIQASLSFIAMKLYINWLQEFIQYFCFLINLWMVGTSWISRKGGILEKGGWSRKGGGVWPPLTTISKLESLRGGSLLFTTQFRKKSGTHFIDLRRMKGCIDLGATKWFGTRDPRIGNPALWVYHECF